MKTLGQRLKWCRANKGVVQSVAAKAVGMTQASISDLENDLYPTSTYTLKLANYYGVNPNWLESGKGKPEIEQNDPVTIEIMRLFNALPSDMQQLLIEQAKLLAKIKK